MRAAGELATVAIALPIAVPMLAVGGALRLVRLAGARRARGRRCPPAGEANLLVHLLAQAVPSYLANAGLRLAAAAPAGAGDLRHQGRSHVGHHPHRARARSCVDNGIAPDAVLVVEGDVEPLLQLATGHLVREIGTFRVKRP